MYWADAGVTFNKTADDLTGSATTFGRVATPLNMGTLSKAVLRTLLNMLGEGGGGRCKFAGAATPVIFYPNQSKFFPYV